MRNINTGIWVGHKAESLAPSKITVVKTKEVKTRSDMVESSMAKKVLFYAC
jgi:hypothetical protein